MEYMVGVDIGGTKIAVCIIDNKGRILEGKRVLTDASKGCRKVISNLTECIRSVLEKHKDLTIKGIGVGIPGYVDRNGKVIFMPNVPLLGFNIEKHLKKRFKCPVFVDNDANCFALGEYIFGKHQSKVLLGLIVGTGVGSGMVSDGRLISGFRGCAGEVGHLLFNNSADKLIVGKNDFESICSGPNISRRYYEAAGVNMLPKKIFISDDPKAKAVIDEEYSSLGKLLGITINILNPDTIVLGGGVCKSISPDRLKKEVEKYAIRVIVNQVKIKHTKQDELAGVLGAAALVLIAE